MLVVVYKGSLGEGGIGKRGKTKEGERERVTSNASAPAAILETWCLTLNKAIGW